MPAYWGGYAELREQKKIYGKVRMHSPGMISFTMAPYFLYKGFCEGPTEAEKTSRKLMAKIMGKDVAQKEERHLALLRHFQGEIPSSFGSKRAVFLDRDGTVIEAYDRRSTIGKISAPFSLAEFRFTPDVEKAMQRLYDAGFLVILVTNQPDVAHGYLTQEIWQDIHYEVITTLPLHDVFMCKHRAEDHCPYKKPSPYLLYAAASKWGIDLQNSFMVGDTGKDVEAGEAAGCTAILLDRPYNADVKAKRRLTSLSEAARFIHGMSRQTV